MTEDFRSQSNTSFNEDQFNELTEALRGMGITPETGNSISFVSDDEGVASTVSAAPRITGEQICTAKEDYYSHLFVHVEEIGNEEDHQDLLVLIFTMETDSPRLDEDSYSIRQMSDEGQIITYHYIDTFMNLPGEILRPTEDQVTESVNRYISSGVFYKHNIEDNGVISGKEIEQILFWHLHLTF